MDVLYAMWRRLKNDVDFDNQRAIDFLTWKDGLTAAEGPVGDDDLPF